MFSEPNPLLKSPLAKNTIRVRQAFLLLGVLAAGWLPVIVGHSIVPKVASLVYLAKAVNPYFVPAQAGLLYFSSPLVVLSALLLFYTPGLLLALALNAAEDVSHWVFNGLCLSLVFLSLWTGAAQFILGRPLLGNEFLLSTALCSAFCFCILLLFILRKHQIAWPIQKADLPTLITLFCIPVLLLIFLTPKFFWENFNGDGAHAFEASRLLLVQPFPFWPPAAGEISSFPGFSSMLFVYPTAWFIRLFGEIEVAARLPYLLYLPGLYCIILALVEHKRFELLHFPERLLIWLALIIYTLAMAYSATYSPYSADIALPATQDSLLMICFFCFVLAFLEHKTIRMWSFAFLTYLASPNGVLLIAFWVLAVFVVYRPIPWARLIHTAMAILCLFILNTLSPALLSFIGSPAPGQEYGLVGILSRFAFLQLLDIRRFLYVIIPCGILPALALFAWKQQDRIARLFTVLTFIYFFFFYFQAHTSLHYFVPVMFTPLIIFWRLNLTSSRLSREWFIGITAIAGIVAVYLSLPANFSPDTTARMIGNAIENRFPGYSHLAPEVFSSSELITNLFPYDWDPRVPKESYGGSPVPWNYYAYHRTGSEDEVNYLIQPVGDPPPAGMDYLAKNTEAALYVRSKPVWEQQRALRPPTPAGSPALNVPRAYLFHSVALAEGTNIINVVDDLEHLGLDMDPILQKLGVKEN